MGSGNHNKVQFAPDLAFFLAMLTHFPLALAVNLEPGGIDDQVCHWPLAPRPVADFHRLGQLADVAVIG